MQSPVQALQPADDAQAPNGELPATACQRCGEQLAAGQEWCLECGTARHGRSSRRGRDAARAATTIAAAVAVLVCGAVAASYAALTDDGAPVAAVPAPAAVAAAPPAATTTQAAPTATTAVAPTTSTAKLPPIATKATLPSVPKSPTPAPSSTTTTKTTTTTTTTKTTGDDGAPKVVALGPEAASVYDPYKRATDQTDPADSYDDDAKTAFTISTTPGPATMGIGLDYNLVNARTVRSIEVATTTPGFSVEVYGAEAGRPADILDPAWKHLTDVADVAKKASDDGKVTITFTPGRYRHLLLWFTTPPSAGPALAISEVRLLD